MDIGIVRAFATKLSLHAATHAQPQLARRFATENCGLLNTSDLIVA